VEQGGDYFLEAYEWRAAGEMPFLGSSSSNYITAWTGSGKVVIVVREDPVYYVVYPGREFPTSFKATVYR
jgi:hypothetical protein